MIKKSEVGKHFGKVGEGLKKTKDKLDGLAKEIASTTNADTKGVEDVIKNASGVIDKLFKSVTNLAGVTKDSGADIGDNSDDGNASAAKAGVGTFIEGVKDIIEAADKSGVKIEPGNAGGQVTAASGATDAIAALGGHTSRATQGAGDKLADEVAKAEPWAIIDKIKNAEAVEGAQLKNVTTNKAGELAASRSNASGGAAGASSKADLVAAVALKAMIQGGKFSANSSDAESVKAAGVSAVNKVLGILDEIIRRTVSSHLEKVREAVKGIKYSETSGINATEASTSNK